MTACVRLFSDSPKCWLATGVSDSLWTLGETLKTRGEEISSLKSLFLWELLAPDSYCCKPVLKLVGFCLNEENIDNPSFKESHQVHNVFSINRFLMGGSMDSVRRLRVFFQRIIVLDWKWFVKITIKIKIVNYELDDGYHERMVSMM